MMKRALLLVFVAFAAAAGFWWASVRLDAHYISRISGIEIPAIAWPVDSYHLDWCIVAKYRVAKSTAMGLAAKKSFAPLPSLSNDLSLNIDALVARFEGDRSAFAKKQGLLGAAGRTKTNRWELVIEPATGLLWAVVMFPDMGGDPP